MATKWVSFNLKDVVDGGKMLSVSVQFVAVDGSTYDDPNPIGPGDNLTLSLAKDVAARRMYSLNVKESSKDPANPDALKAVVVAAADIPKYPPDPTPADAFFVAHDALLRLLRAVEHGYLAPDDGAVTDARAAAAVLFKVAIVSDPRWR